MLRSHAFGNGSVTACIPPEMAALMDALQLHGAFTDVLADLKDTEWERLLDISDRAHLTMALAQLPRAAFPAWVADRLQRNVADNAARYERIQAIYREVVSALDRAGIPHVVLKGFSHAPDYVKDPGLRMQGDLDLYCEPQHTDMAVKALESIGYKPFLDMDYRLADHAPSMIRNQGWVWRGNMYDPAMPLSVEIHFCLWNERLLLIPLPEVGCFWDRRVVRKLGDFVFSSFSPVDQLGYIALHVMRNVLTGRGVAHLTYELATFLHRRAADGQFWAEWESTHSPSTRSIEAIAFSLAIRWFSGESHTAVQKQMDSLPSIQRSWLERFGGCPLEDMFRPTREGRILHFILADSGANRRRILRKTIFPTLISKPGSLAVRVSVRNLSRREGENPWLDYLVYLSQRLTVNGSAVARFLWKGLWLCLFGRRMVSEQKTDLKVEEFA